MSKTIYCVDLHIRNGAITRFYHRVGEGTKLRFGVLMSGKNDKLVRFPTTKQCYLSYLKACKPYIYNRLTKDEKR